MNKCEPPIPPEHLRFMAESRDDFFIIADHNARHVLDFIDDPSSSCRLIDVGCGYGRLAYGLLRRGFAGRYIGFDILAPHIKWLQQNFRCSGDQYSFLWIDLYNQRYSPQGQPLHKLVLPSEITGNTLCALSVFTHMYQDELEDYFGRLMDVLENSCKIVATFFCLPDDADPYQSEGPFGLTQQISDVAFIHDPEDPLHVIAFRRHFLMSLFARHGLRIVGERKGRWYSPVYAEEFQDWFFLARD